MPRIRFRDWLSDSWYMLDDIIHYSLFSTIVIIRDLSCFEAWDHAQCCVSDNQFVALGDRLDFGPSSESYI